MSKIGIAAAISLLLPACLCQAQITPSGPPQPLPMGDVVFVLDRSGSIDETEFEDMVLSIADAIGTSIPHTQNYRVAVVAFSDNTLSGPSIPFKKARSAALDTALADLAMQNTSGGTDVSTGMEVALDLIATQSTASSKHVILLTDATVGQLGNSVAIAQMLRNDYDTRVSVGYLRGNCALLTTNPPCVVDMPSPAEQAMLAMARIANAPIHLPDVGPPYGIRLWGVLNCIDDVGDMVEQYSNLISDALCGFETLEPVDLDGNLVPDVCDLFFDCDANGVYDGFDPDCDGDLLPDACERDCDHDGIPNGCDPTPGLCPACPDVPAPAGGGS